MKTFLSCKVIRKTQNRTKQVDQSAVILKTTLEHVQSAVDADYLIPAGLDIKI